VFAFAPGSYIATLADGQAVVKNGVTFIFAPFGALTDGLGL